MKRPRLFAWLIINVLLLLLIGLLHPSQVPVSLYKLSLVTMAGVVGYWLDRSLFPYARPDQFMSRPFSIGSPYIRQRVVPPSQQMAFSSAMLRRAIIVGCAMMAIGMGA